MTSILFLVRHAAITALLVATAWAAGRAVLRRWAAPAPAALAVAVGMAALAQALYFLGLLGCLRRWPIVALAVLVHLLAAPDWRRVGPAWRRFGAPPHGAALATGLFAILLWALSLYPPLAFDESLYHLPFTRAFAASGALPFLPDLRWPVFPQLAEIMAAPLYLFGDDVDTHALSWLATLAVAGLLLAWHDREHASSAGRLSAALWLGSPIVIYLAGVGYVEPLLALWGTAACYAAARAEQGGVAGARGWWLLAGFLAGSAASVKYHGLFFVAALGVALVIRRRWRPALLYGASSLGALLPSYARIVLHTGNPLFPFYRNLSGVTAWSPSDDVAHTAFGHWSEFATLPWRLVFDRTSVGSLPPHSPALLLALPLAVYAAVREPGARMPLLLAVGYALLAPMDARYLVPVLPLLAVAAGLAIARWPRLRIGTVGAVIVVVLLPGLLYGFFGAGRRGALPTTPAARERFVETWFPIYPAVRFLNDREPGGYTAYGLGSEEMAYWARGRWLGDVIGAGAFQRVQPLLDDPRALHAALRDLGVQYLVAPRGRRVGLRPDWRLPGDLFPLIYRDPLAEVYAVVEPSAR